MRHSLSEAGCGSSAPLPLGESGASLVKGGSERRASAAWMPLTKTGRSPGIPENASAGNIGADLAGSRFLSGGSSSAIDEAVDRNRRKPTAERHRVS
jgi:hypothetical protein